MTEKYKSKYSGKQIDLALEAALAYLTSGGSVSQSIESANYVTGSTGWKIGVRGSNDGFAEFSDITIRGSITATTGAIGGWTIGATTLTSANITLDSGNDSITTSNITIDGANDKITVSGIDIDGANNRIRSSNYVSGVFGAGFTLSPDLLEVGNVAVRGIFRTAVFQKDVVSAVGGNLVVLPADVLATDMTAGDSDFTLTTEAGDTRTTEAGDTRIFDGLSALIIEGNETFTAGDFLRIKADDGISGVDDEWMEVLLAAGAPIYAVGRDKGADYAANTNPAWPKGAAVVNYGPSGEGAVYMTASETNAPYLSVFTHAGSPWDTITTHLRLGNLNGFLGYSTDKYGIAIGEATKYLKYDPTNGMRIRGVMTIEATSTIDGLAASKIAGWQHGSDSTKIDGGDIYTNTVTATQISVSTLSAIAADVGTLTAGIVADHATAASRKIELDLDNKHLKVWDAQGTPVLRVHLGFIP